MLKIGDSIIYSPDGTRGTILEIGDNLYHVIWEDHYSSWEKGGLLKKLETRDGPHWNKN